MGIYTLTRVGTGISLFLYLQSPVATRSPVVWHFRFWLVDVKRKLANFVAKNSIILRVYSTSFTDSDGEYIPVQIC